MLKSNEWEHTEARQSAASLFSLLYRHAQDVITERKRDGDSMSENGRRKNNSSHMSNFRYWTLLSHLPIHAKSILEACETSPVIIHHVKPLPATDCLANSSCLPLHLTATVAVSYGFLRLLPSSDAQQAPKPPLVRERERACASLDLITLRCERMVPEKGGVERGLRSLITSSSIELVTGKRVVFHRVNTDGNISRTLCRGLFVLTRKAPCRVFHWRQTFYQLTGTVSQ